MMLLLSLLAYIVLHLLVGAVVYLGVCVLEERGREWASLGFLLGSVGILVVSTVWGQAPVAVVAAFITAVCGASFHRKSGGASPTWGLAFLLMVFAALLTWVLLRGLDSSLFGRFPPIPLLPWGIFRTVSVLLVASFYLTPVFWAPFSLWVCQKLRLRHDVDGTAKQESIETGSR